MRVVRRLFWVSAFVALVACPAFADKRVALVIGNGAYVHAGPLANPKNDASDVAAALKAKGFNVILGLDLDKRGMDEKLRDFARAVGDGDTAVFFYAGHGLQVAGANFLVPIDAKLESERDLDFEAVRVDFVLRQMELNRETKTNIVFLDACRDNPLARSLARSMGTRSASIGKGLAQVEGGVGTFVAFSTQPGNVALDGDGRNSPFAAALSKHIAEPGKNLNAVMIEVRKDVLAATSGKQVPWDHSALTGDFYFDLAALPSGPPKSPVAGAEESKALNERIKALEDELKQNAGAEQEAQLAELKEKARGIEETNREDWKTIFDLRREAMSETNPDKKRKLNDEASKLQLKITRRGMDQRKLSERISQLEEKMGVKPPDAAAPRE